MAMDGNTNFSEWQKNIKDALENIKNTNNNKRNRLWNE